MDDKDDKETTQFVSSKQIHDEGSVEWEQCSNKKVIISCPVKPEPVSKP